MSRFPDNGGPALSFSFGSGKSGDLSNPGEESHGWKFIR